MRDETNMVDGIEYSVESLKRKLAELLAAAFSRTLFLVEEFVADPAAPERLPVDYRFFMFGDRLAMICCSRGLHDRVYYGPDWKTMPFQADIRDHEIGNYEKPAEFEELLLAARELGTAYGTFVRVDLYRSDSGPVFAEFAPDPTAGRKYTPEADAYLNRHWLECFRDRV